MVGWWRWLRVSCSLECLLLWTNRMEGREVGTEVRSGAGVDFWQELLGTGKEKGE